MPPFYMLDTYFCQMLWAVIIQIKISGSSTTIWHFVNEKYMIFED